MTKLVSSPNSKFKNYAHPECLVDCEWAQEHIDDPNVRFIESNEDVLLYDSGHIPGAIHVDWSTDLQMKSERDYLTPTMFAELCGRHGIGKDTLCVFYGDKSNWWAAYAFWTFHLFGHSRLAILDGGRKKWLAEERPFTEDVKKYSAVDYPVPSKRDDYTHRAFYDDALDFSQNNKPLLDVRSAGEFRGEITHMPDYPQEGVLRAGHIPGAISCPWNRSINEDGTFKTYEELKSVYEEELNFNSKDETIVYCRIGERSSHTWFVLTYLLGFENVKNYDGSWTEWGNRVRAPIALGD